MEQLQSWLLNIDNACFEQAQVTLEPFTYEGKAIVSKLYLLFLRNICLFFGNVYNACLIGHFIVFLLAAVVWFCVIRKLFKNIIVSVVLTVCIFVPLGALIGVHLNPFVLWLLFFGIVLFIVVSCFKSLFVNNLTEHVYDEMPIEETSVEEPVVTVVNFDDENAVVVPEEERPAIFIPKSMTIPKRKAKPKLDYNEAFAEHHLFYDVDPPENDDYDFQV